MYILPIFNILTLDFCVAVGLPQAAEEDALPTEMESIVPEVDKDEGYDEEEDEEEEEEVQPAVKSKKEQSDRKQKLVGITDFISVLSHRS